jgi:hypothetical protein
MTRILALSLRRRQGLFGRPIPVLVHELEYYDAIAMQNLAANPPGVADDFIRWCRDH